MKGLRSALVEVEKREASAKSASRPSVSQRNPLESDAHASAPSHGSTPQPSHSAPGVTECSPLKRQQSTSFEDTLRKCEKKSKLEEQRERQFEEFKRGYTASAAGASSAGVSGVSARRPFKEFVASLDKRPSQSMGQ